MSLPCPVHASPLITTWCSLLYIGRFWWGEIIFVFILWLVSCTFERTRGNQTKIWNKEIECHSKEQEAGLSICPNVSELPVYLYSESIYSSSTCSSTHLSIHHHPSSVQPFHSSFIYPSIFHPSINPPKKLWLSLNGIPVTVLGFLQPPQIQLFTYFPHFTFSLLGHQNSFENTITQSTTGLPDLLVDHELSTM